MADKLPEGKGEWKLVPVEATQRMLDAGVDAGVKASPDPWCPKTWAAMLAAAPAAPVGVNEAMVERAYAAWVEIVSRPDGCGNKSAMRAALQAAIQGANHD